MNTVPVEHGSTRMIAHCGASSLEKRNTMAAFIAAGNRSYWGMETDVRYTADGEIIVIHDENTLRETGVDLPVEQTDFATLRRLPVLDENDCPGRGDLCLPSLKEYIHVCKKYEKGCIVELKSEFSDSGIRKILDTARAEAYLEHVTFIAFSRENLLKIRRQCPNQPVQQLGFQINEKLFDFLKENRFDLDVQYESLTEDWVRRLHEAGIQVNCWTVDKKEDAERLIAWGVDYITSNCLE